MCLRAKSHKLLPKVCLFDFVLRGARVFVQSVVPVSWEEVNTRWETVGADFKPLFQCPDHVAALHPRWCKVSKTRSEIRSPPSAVLCMRVRGTGGTAALSVLQHDPEQWGTERLLPLHCPSLGATFHKSGGLFPSLANEAPR